MIEWLCVRGGCELEWGKEKLSAESESAAVFATISLPASVLSAMAAVTRAKRIGARRRQWATRKAKSVCVCVCASVLAPPALPRQH